MEATREHCTRYLSPTPLILNYRKAWVKAIDGRKAVIVGELRADDMLV